MSRFLPILLLFALNCFVSSCAAPSLQVKHVKESETAVWGYFGTRQIVLFEKGKIEGLAFTRSLIGEMIKGDHVKLTFHKDNTEETFITEIPMWTSFRRFSPFVVVLPEGRYYLTIEYRGSYFKYKTVADKPLICTGGKNAVYIGDLQMMISNNSQPILLDDGNFDERLGFFLRKNPGFRGNVLRERVTNRKLRKVNEREYILY